MEATVYDAFFVGVFKRLRFELSTLESENFQKKPSLLKLKCAFSNENTFVWSEISVYVWEKSCENRNKYQTHII